MPPRVLADHNGGVTEKVFFDFHREYESLKAQASSIAGKMRALKKRGTDDGIDIEEYEYQRKRRNRPIAERQRAYENGRLYLRFWKDPLGAKMTEIKEFSDEVGLTDEERQKKWEDEGYVAGAAGKNRDVCPHEDPNSLGARFWMAGYDKGQAMLGSKIKKGPVKPEEKPAEKPAPAAAASSKEPIVPKVEPEVEAAGKRRRGGGVTYWHNEALQKVYEINISDATPEGAVSVTRKEYDRLKAEYDKKADDDWETAGKAAAETLPAEEEEVDDEAPPADPAS